MEEFKIQQVPSRSLFLETPDGPEQCKACGVWGVVTVKQYSEVEGEPQNKLIGKKCMWCDNRESAK